MKLSNYLKGAALGVLASAAAHADVVDNSFYPYADEVPTADGLTAGTVIDQTNVGQFTEVLDPALADQISKGWVSITVGETTSFDLHPNYVKATRDGHQAVSLGDETGQINGFVAGRPFPAEPSADDPRAGEKLAWNYQYGYNWGDNAAIYPFYWRFKDLNTGKVERTLKLNLHFLNFKHRVNQAPTPEVENNPDDIFRSIYLQVLEPFDLKNTQLLIYRYSNDLKPFNAWLYLGFQRRVRRLATGQVTDSFLGSDLMIEDFEGYNGSISDMNWTYKGTKNILLPFYNHNDLDLADDIVEDDGYQYVDFGGQGGCYPEITWQLRKTYILESDPVDDNHPIAKRVHYVDAQTFTLPRTLIYDRKGDLWKTFTIGQSHPDAHDDINKGSGVSIDDSFSMLDVQAAHCTTGHFRGQVDSSLNPQSMFTVQNLRATGR